MKKNPHVITLCLALLCMLLASSLTACGQKGDLVLPEQDKAEKAKKKNTELF